MSAGYRDLFATDELASHYDDDQYRPGSYWEVLWRLERGVLAQVIGALPSRARCLDYACGTGRVLAFTESAFEEAVGVDVNEAMLRRARQRVRKATVRRSDLAAGAELEGGFDLITSFRFLLNVEPEVRRAAIGALALRLRDERSRLVVNCHGALESYKAAGAPLRWARTRLRGAAPENVLSGAAVRALLEEAGLEVLDVRGMGVLPGAAVRWMGPAAREALERAAMASPAGRLGVNKVYVCRRRA